MCHQATMMGQTCLLLIISNSLICRIYSFSSLPSSNQSPLKVLPLQTHDHEPKVLSLPNILSRDKSTAMLDMIETSIASGALVTTSSYQEDIFCKSKHEEEEEVLKSIIEPLNDRIPSHIVDPLEAFVYAVTKHQDSISEEDIIAGANIIQRRQAIERWKTEEGLAIMKLSADYESSNNQSVDWDSITLGKRYQLPPSMLNELEKFVSKLLLGSWTTRDATIVKYSPGDSQVPHIDPCDATILFCLKSCEEGGETCFPLLEEQLRIDNIEGTGILFFSSNKFTGDDSRDTLSLHHGGKVLKGEKVEVQLMLEWIDDDISNNSVSTPESWLDFIVDASVHI